MRRTSTFKLFAILIATSALADDPPAGNGRILGNILESRELAALTHRFYPDKEPIFDEYIKPGVKFGKKFPELKEAFEDVLNPDKYHWYMTSAPLDNCPRPNSYFIGGVRVACQEFPNIMIAEEPYKNLDLSDPKLIGATQDDMNEALREKDRDIIGWEMILARTLGSNVQHLDASIIMGMVFRPGRPDDQSFRKSLSVAGFDSEYTLASNQTLVVAKPEAVPVADDKLLANLMKGALRPSCSFTIENSHSYWEIHLDYKPASPQELIIYRVTSLEETFLGNYSDSAIRLGIASGEASFKHIRDRILTAMRLYGCAGDDINPNRVLKSTAQPNAEQDVRVTLRQVPILDSTGAQNANAGSARVPASKSLK